MKRIHTIIIILASYIFYNPLYAAITASIQNGTNFTTDDIIELLVTTNQLQDQIDVSTLNKDFKVLSQGKQVSHTIMNGNASSKIQWVIGLQANKTGTVIIPALKVGSEFTQPITLNIKKTLSSTDQNAEIFMQVEANDQSVYVNAPLTITINIYVSADITARNLELNAEENPAYVLYKLSESNKQVFYQDKRYNLFQVKYIGFYNSVGKYTLPQFSLSGVKLKNTNKHHDIFSLYQQQWLPFSRNNPSIPVNILPPATGFSLQNWLPAESVSVQETWSHQTSDVLVGDAIQRVITISGTNTPAEHLPVLFDHNKPNDYLNNNYKIYIDKPELINNIDSNKLNSTLTQKITYIPTNPGILNLPEQQIIWWNTRTGAKQHLTLSAKNFNVNSASNTQSTNFTPSSNLPTPHVTTPLTKANSTSRNKLENKSSPSSNQVTSKLYLLLVGIILLLSLAIGYLIWLIRKIKKTGSTINFFDYAQPKANKTKQSLTHKADTSLKKLKLLAGKKPPNCKALYKELTYLADLSLADDQTNAVSKLNSFINKLPQIHQQNIHALMGTLYGNNNTTWDAIFFINEVLPELKRIVSTLPKKNSSVHTISELYPQ